MPFLLVKHNLVKEEGLDKNLYYGVPF